MKRESASEVAVMKANTKKMSVQLASLERQLQQKVCVESVDVCVVERLAYNAVLIVACLLVVVVTILGTRKIRIDADM